MNRILKPIGLLLASVVLAAGPGPSPEGNWLTENKAGIVEIYRCGDALCGSLAWFHVKQDDANPLALDLKNPDPLLRNRPLCGLIFISEFRLAGPDSWEGGTIYDPESGNTYHATLKLQADGTIRLRGYIGISLIGASEVWTRYPQAVPSCPTR